MRYVFGFLWVCALTMVAGLFVTVALLGPGSARAQGSCSELTLYGDLGTTAGCGDTRSDGTLLVQDLNGTPGIDCPGTNCDGDSYTFFDSSDLIRVVLAGMHHDDADDIGMQDCNSDVRWSLVETWQNLFEGTCTDATCEQAQHLWRTPDDDAATATVLELLGLPAIDAEPFCNGDELEDNDPIRRPCADGEDVCQPSGTLGLVLPIVPGPGSTEPCSLGVFKWKILPFTRFVCPQGINPLFGLCLQPQDAQGNFGCLNPAFNTSFGTPGGVDGRVHNLWALNVDGTAPIVDGKELVAAFDRIHTANTIAEGASVCLQPTAGARIECLTEASPCSLGTDCRGEPGVFACTEQGIRAAIAAGGGPHTFDCPGPTTVLTTSEITIDNDVILDGEGNLIVDAGYQGGEPLGGEHRVFGVDSDVTAELRGFVVVYGYADSGGGIFNQGGLTLTNSIVAANTAFSSHYLAGGGGIQNTGTLTLVNSTVTGNEAVAFGGGIRNSGASPPMLTLIESVVSENTALGGGGIINDDGSVTLSNSTVSGNTAVFGGGIYTFEGTLTLTDSQVSSNDADFAPCQQDPELCGDLPMAVGGGILNDRSNVELLRTEVSLNRAGPMGAGAGILNGSTNATPGSESTLTATNSTISNNVSEGDGTIYEGIPSGTGAGVLNYGVGATLVLTHVTVADNTASFGGGAIFNTGTVTVGSTVIEGECVSSGGLISNGYNIESPANTCGLTGAGDQTAVPSEGPEGLNLGLLQDNGGPTLTQAPEYPSAAVDQILPADCAVTTDQRGEPRPEAGGSMCDVGAVEVEIYGPTVFACNEEGIRDAIAAGGGPHRFDCAGPTTVTTTSEIAINNDVILNGEGNLTVSGNNTHRVFSVARNITAELRGLTVSGGSSADLGGGISNSGTLTLTESTVSGNMAPFLGGGIFNDGTLTLTESTVSGNMAQFPGSGGGGIINNGAAATLTLTHSSVSGNTADNTGGISNDGMATLTHSTVSGNDGGGISNSGTLTLTESTVSDNKETNFGAGIHNFATATLTNSTVSGNTATYSGGGIANRGTVTLSHSTVSGNRTYNNDGGGIHNDGTATLTLTNSTVSGNAATFGGGIGNAGTATLTLKNSVVDGDCLGAMTSGGYNIESPGNTCGFTATGDQHTVLPDGPSGLNLGSLQNNGGPTLTHAPQAPSAAINQIPLSACELTTEQRGEPRPESGGSMCDVGAVEVQAP